MRTVAQIVIVVVVLAASAALARWMIESRPEIEPEPPGTVATPVEVITVRAEPFRLTVRGRGEVAPRERSRLVAEVDGRVATVAPALVTGGDFAAGEVLVRLDTADLEVARARAAAALRQAETALAREEAEAAVAARHYAELGEGEASELALRRPQLEEARARVAAARADLAWAERNLARATITAPFDGRVRTEDVGPGQLVTRGQVLAELYATDRAEVRVPLSDEALAHLERVRIGLLENGPAATLRCVFAGARRTWRGRVTRIEGEVDRTSRMITVVVGVEDPYDQAAEEAGAPLVPGLFVDVEIEGRREPAALLVPRSAIRDGGRVFVVDGEDRLRFREVTVAWRDAERVLVADGLAEGERVCVSPLATPVDGMRVRVLAAGAEPSGGSE